MEKNIIQELKAIGIFVVVYLIIALVDWHLMGANGHYWVMNVVTLFLAIEWIKSNLLK